MTSVISVADSVTRIRATFEGEHKGSFATKRSNLEVKMYLSIVTGCGLGRAQRLLRRLPIGGEIDLTRGAGSGPAQDSRVGGKRKRDLGQAVDRQSGVDRHGRHLDDLDRSVTNNMAAQDLTGGAVNDQLAETIRSAVDDRPRCRIERNVRHNNIVRFACFCLGQAGLSVFGIGVAPDRHYVVLHLRGWPAYGICAGGKSLLDRLWNKEHMSGHVAGGEDVRR